MEDETIRPNAAGFAEQTTRASDFHLTAGEDGEFDPESRAVANANIEQMRAEALSEIAGCKSFILASLSERPDDVADAATGPDLEYAFQIQFTGMMEGDSKELEELLWQTFAHVIERLADLSQSPPQMALMHFMRRWVLENGLPFPPG